TRILLENKTSTSYKFRCTPSILYLFVLVDKSYRFGCLFQYLQIFTVIETANIQFSPRLCTLPILFELIHKDITIYIRKNNIKYAAFYTYISSQDSIDRHDIIPQFTFLHTCHTNLIIIYR